MRVFQGFLAVLITLACIGWADIGYHAYDAMTADDDVWHEVDAPEKHYDFMRCYTKDVHWFFWTRESEPTCFFYLPPDMMSNVRR